MIRRNILNLDSSRTQNVGVLLLLMFFLLLSIASSPGVTVTLDEPLHYEYGVFILQGNTTRIDDSSMPVSALNALPQRIASFLPDGLLKIALARFFVARLATIVFSTVFAFLVFHWSRSLYGFVPAVFSILLYVLDPNVIAHSQLVTTDVFMMGVITLSFYLLWRFSESRSVRDGLICACVLGLSQLVKYTALALFPLCLLALLLHDWSLIRDTHKNAGVRGLGRYAGKLAVFVVIALALSIIIINLGFLFNRTFTPFREYQFRSELFRSLQADFPALGRLPVPVPYPYLEGLDWVRDTEQTGNRYGNIYLLGHLSKSKGFLGYYFIASLLKVPIATQVIIVASLGFFLLRRRPGSHFLENEIFLLVPVAFFAVYFNFFFNTQIGIRYYLVVFPLLYVFCGSLFVGWETRPAAAKAAAMMLVVYLAISVLSYFPYYIPYFNEIVWNKTQTYKYLSDSNLEWGQSRDDLSRYLSEHKDAVYAPATVQAGRLVVGGSDLVGILENPNRYAWLRDNFEPQETIAYCYFVYDISPAEIGKLCASTAYCK